jgi:hypothetical protein
VPWNASTTAHGPGWECPPSPDQKAIERESDRSLRRADIRSPPSGHHAACILPSSEQARNVLA